MRKIDDMGFAALLMVVSLLFAWILWPFFGAILWAVVTAIVFVPVNQRVTRAMPDKPSLAALVTVWGRWWPKRCRRTRRRYRTVAAPTRPRLDPVAGGLCSAAHNG